MLERFAAVRREEREALAWAFLHFFAVLCAYYLIRPLRDEMGIRGGVGNLKWMYTGTFLAMLVAVPCWSAVVARLPRRSVVPIAYRFVALTLLAFFAAERLGAPVGATARIFFVWVSVLNLLVVSVLWSFHADVFRAERARRLYGLVAAGGSAGAIAGPWAASALAGAVGPSGLLVVAAAALEGAVLCVARLSRWAERERAGSFGESPEEPVGGGVFEGFRLALRSPYLLGISALLLFYSGTSTVAYQEQARIVEASFADSAARTATFARIDLAVNVLAIALQGLVAGPMLARLGAGATIAVLPVVTGAGFLALASRPGSLGTLVAFQVVRRGAQYGLERPARETLFTTLGGGAKYKAKSFMDTVVFRGGDAASIWAYATTAALGVPGPVVWRVLAAACVAWVLLARGVARRQGRTAETGR